MTALSIDLVTDIVCPWCFIGLTRLDRALQESGIEAEIRHHPYFLDPDLPEDGVDVAERLKAKYGGDIGAMFARVEAEAKKSGIALDLSRQPRQRPTDRAHALIAAAEAKGTQHALARALFETHFMEHRNIADPEVLAEVGARFGFTKDEALAAIDTPALARVREAAAGMAQMGIGGVPFFVFDRRLALSGAQAEETFIDALRQATEPAAAR
ncbi:DsbA family oxidoreductase [Kaistia geumhonensis]|uniref:DsbA family dithiol-disulfide isomerase n=1 Tax=Kaistia geumhonensis TaxID=410839 RepID=A0ABU0M1S4_9HYPH|nr:DsbA family oxidoreductase [Kaistia geumhonensis]MCX5479876.1 DsbA family oxidoreductase [Kaistia geumhonensis]MDQ0514898.1 putative DsbA family dithiol-disulfide isomerase [Kaistia geumhonensis]